MFGSYLRFGIGLIISLMALWSFFGDKVMSPAVAILSALYLILVVAWVLFRF